MSNSGGTLTLPSPTHPHHHVDVQAGLRTLRRSLSRSPSKFSLMRTASQSSSDTGSLPSTPSIRRVQSQYFGQNTSINAPSGNQPHTQSPLSTPFRPNVRLSLRSAKSAKSPAPSSTSNKPFSRHRTSPKSPSRRALSQASSTSGNCVPSPTPSSSLEPGAPGQENINIFRTRSPAPRKAAEKAANRHSMHLDMTGSSQLSTSRFAEMNSTTLTSIASPLKRNDATMNLDQTLSGSPKAKRRSYGPSSLSVDFNILDHPPPSPNSECQDESAREYDWTSSGAASLPEPMPSPAPSVTTRRAGSLRKSTLQQRERTSWGKRNAAQQLAHNSNEATTPQRNQISWGRRQAAQHLAQGPNETGSPNGKNRPRLSLDHFVPPPPRGSPFNAQGPLPNPSAHTLNQQVQMHQPHPLSNAMTSSSSNSSLVSESPAPLPALVSEKSRAPMNFSKSLPIGAPRPQADGAGQAGVSVSTPDYKQIKPYEGAFASTGLISKMNRNPEIAPPGGGYGAVPDTPCKKQPSGFATFPPIPQPGGGKARGRHIRHTFGAPSTPFDISTPNRSMNLFADPQQGPVLFAGWSNHSRKGNILGVYGDSGRSPSRTFGGSESSNDGQSSPTPAKQQTVPRSSGKLSRFDESPTANRRLPAPMSAVGTDAALQQDLAASSSPLEQVEFVEKASPRTPQGSILPPDASHLSISNGADNLLPGTSDRNLTYPPATPTTRHGNPSSFFERRAITPINGAPAHDLDEALMSRFGKVEFVGKGEFSIVYKVTDAAQPARTVQQGFFTPTHRSPPSPSGKVYAVKKLTLPIQGRNDRALRLREVSVLETLKGCDHILQLIDNWEDNSCLYIQTEYCDEGGLDAFLSYVGLKGRLDDFRIWKIMLEVGRGLKHIHDAGFIHLDLKPANILINFEGTLKIGDFGLTTLATPGKITDLEGDREYMAPEALRADIGQSADVFSLGLILLEMAANVKLPENGTTWSALREGDFAEIPCLTQGMSAIMRDATGMPIEDGDRTANLFGDGAASQNTRRSYNFRNTTRQSGDIFGLGRKSELQHPPDFMKDPSHYNSLDIVVKSMLAPNPYDRPTVAQLLDTEALVWVAARRRASATVFEGNWGPADEAMALISLDTEMTDV